MGFTGAISPKNSLKIGWAQNERRSSSFAIHFQGRNVSLAEGIIPYKCSYNPTHIAALLVSRLDISALGCTE